jgi:SAM-dependent methyltransferase
MPKCRICQADGSFQTIRAPNVFGGRPEHNFWECSKCTAIYLFPALSPDEEKFFYLKEFEKFMSKRVGDHRDWSNAEIHKITNQDQVDRRMPFLNEYLKPDMDLLEIGCSSGFMLDAFREMSINCYGIEPSGEFGEYLISNGYEIFNDLKDIGNKKFDLITHFFVFEHIADPYSFIKDNLNHLNDGGVMISEVPCANDPLTSIYDIEEFENFYWSIAHHYYYTPKSLTYVLDKIGCKYKIIPEQRYDLSNHMQWLQEGKPGGQGRYSENFGSKLNDSYKQRMIESWQCDTMFLYAWKE